MMYVLENWYKFVLCAVLFSGYGLFTTLWINSHQIDKTEVAMLQLGDSGHVVQNGQMKEHIITNFGLSIGWLMVGLLCIFVFMRDLCRLAKSAFLVMFVLCLTGCNRKPFEPAKLEVIKSNEEAFLLPLTGDGKKQASTSNEEYLRDNLVFTKQVKIPQQWVQTGHETYGWNGEWRDSALLIKVDKSPVTREWTADPNSGTSIKNEAIWVMTSDQVEFSTGWTITARIESRDDAVKFLHNYPNGSLTQVLDTEVRSKLQAEFGLAVTDLPMDTLRKAATPVINGVTKRVAEFFKNRGISVTNIGITGGFVYKDKTIMETMVKVFNAEQEQAIAVAATRAQEERNKAVIFKAQGEADALMRTKKAEAEGIRLVAEARSYELDKAKQDLSSFMQLKQLELQKDLLHKWDGKYPTNYMSGGQSPQMLLQLPPMRNDK